MRNRSMLLISAVILIMITFHPVASAQGGVGADATPPQEGFEIAPGVTAELLPAVEDPPSLYRLHFAADVSYAFADDPLLSVAYVESGTITLRLDAPVTVALIDMPEAAGENVAADTEFTMTAGDYLLLPPFIAGEVRNDGDETATITVAGIAPEADFVTSDPAECQVEPRTLDSVIALVEPGAAGTPALSTPSVDEPAGEPTDAETAEAVTAIARESVSCFNAGDFLRQFAFYTDNGLRTIMPEGTTEEDIVAFLGGTAEPLPEDVWESVHVRDIMVLPDGRVTAYVVVRSPEGQGTFTTFVTFVDRGDGWLIDSDVNVSEELATPTT